MQKVTLLILMLVCGAAGAAGVYTWTDEQGKVHYGDRPGNAAAREITLPAAPAPDEGQRERLQKQQKLLEVFEAEREERREQASKRIIAQQQREQECKAARVRLKQYEQAGGFKTLEADGTERQLSKPEYRQVLDDARKAVVHWCEGA